MIWDGVEATGPVLYASDEVLAEAPHGTARSTFDTGGLPHAYVLFLSTSELPADAPLKLPLPPVAADVPGRPVRIQQQVPHLG